MTFKEIEEITYSILSEAKIEYAENSPLDDVNRWVFGAMNIFFNKYQILICWTQFRNSKSIRDLSIDVYENNTNLDTMVFGIEPEYPGFEHLIKVKCNRRNLKTALEWVKENSVN